MRRLSSPLVVAIISVALWTAFALVHLQWLGGDASRFVLAGDGLSDPKQVPRGLYVIRGSFGYDGQAFYRIALDPLTDEKTDHGITLDSPPYRAQRIGYPGLAWVASGGGRPAAIPWALIGINVAALGAVGWVGGALARAFGRNPLWGLIFPLYPGFAVSVARDLAEPLAAAFMLAGLLLLRRNRATWAALAMTAAILTRETTAVVPAGLAIVWFFGTVRRSRVRRAREFLIPLGVLAVWQLFLYARWDQVAGLANENAVDPPFVGLVDQVKRYVSSLSSDAVLSLVEIGLVVVLLVAVLVVIRSGKVQPYERWAFVAATVGVILFDKNIWYDHAHYLRALTEYYLLGATILLAGMRSTLFRLAVPVTGMCGTLVSIFARNL